MRIIVSLLIILTLNACIHFKVPPKPTAGCPEIQQEITKRENLFQPLSQAVIDLRKQVALSYTTTNPPGSDATITVILDAITNAPQSAEFIPIDLRNYDEVILGNIMFTNLPDYQLEGFLPTSKFNQETFILVNFSIHGITVKYGNQVPNKGQDMFIPRGDLRDSELVFNVSNVNTFNSNIKFTENKVFSIIADNIPNIQGGDFREASNLQKITDQRWVMPVYSIKNSNITFAKDTTGIIYYVRNNGATLNVQSFDQTSVSCYTDPSGPKFPS